MNSENTKVAEMKLAAKVRDEAIALAHKQYANIERLIDAAYKRGYNARDARAKKVSEMVV